MTPLLDVSDLSVVFGASSAPVRAVHELSFSLHAGQSLAIVGESGCGKSVSALSLMGLVPPPGVVQSGTIMFRGRDVLKLPLQEMQQLRGRELAMIFQDPMTALNPVLTVGYQLMEPLLWHLKLKPVDARRQVVDTMTLVGIGDASERIGDYPHQFSGGQRQRIMIAMAIICGPSLLIADEPTTALDVTIQAQIVALVKQLQDKLDMAVIWITHDLALVAGIVDRVAVMYAGSIVEYGPVARIFGDAKHPYTQGLLKSMPRMDSDVQERLNPIEGVPPNLALEIEGCPFAPRCPRVFDRCLHERPTMVSRASSHSAACWQVTEK